MMKNKGEMTLIGAAILGLLLLSGVGVAYFSKADSPLEQGIEGVIKHQTGLEIDFSKDKKEDDSKD